MDLDYPSEKRNNLSQQLNCLDRRYGSIVLSNPKIVKGKQIPPALKNKLRALIAADSPAPLLRLMDRQAVSLNDQISKEGLGWTILHYIAKSNSKHCLDLCLRKAYQDDPALYIQALNSKTIEGDSPLLIACQSKSNEVIKMILNYGGADIHLINCRKQSAYQLALSEGNEETLQLLMKYQLRMKRRSSINAPLLLEPIKVQAEDRCWAAVCKFLSSLCWDSKAEEELKETETDRKMVKAPLDAFGEFEISWCDPETILLHKLPLFGPISSPFSIRQSRAIVSNLLVVFQSLAEHPELIKNMVFKGEGKYYVKLHQGGQQKIQWVDSLFPFFQQTQESVFLSLDDQMWPMVLHKALSQFYKGFFEPGKVPLDRLLQTLTGNHCFRKAFHPTLSMDDKVALKTFVSSLLNSNCIHLLRPRPECPLKPEEGRIESFSILRSLGNHFLINCPFISDLPTRKEQESRQMKLMKAHYNNPTTMAIWISPQELATYFEDLVFCQTQSATPPNTTKISLCSNRIFIAFKTTDRVQHQDLSFYFYQQSDGGEAISPKKVVGWSIKGKDCVEKVDCSLFGAISVDCVEPRQSLLFMCEFQPAEPTTKLNMTHRCPYVSEVEVLDAFLGDLEFIECCKKFFNDHHEDYTCPIIEVIGEYLLVMAVNQQPCFIPMDSNFSDEDIVEGLLSQGRHLKMFAFRNIQFAVLMNKEGLSQNLKILTYDSEESSPDTEET